MHGVTVGTIATAALALAIYVQPAPPMWITILIWCVLFLITNYANDSAADRDRINRAITRRDNLFAYTKMVDLLLRSLQRMIMPTTIEQEPKPSGFLRVMFWRMMPSARDAQDLEQLKKSPFSWPVLDTALKLAIIYPLYFMLTQWAVTGRETGLGEAPLFPADIDWIWRLAIICLLSTVIFFKIMASATQRRVYETAAEWLFWFAGAGAFAASFAVAGAFAFGFAGAVAFAGAGAGAFAFAGAVSFAMPGAFAFAGAGAFAFAFAFAGAVAGVFLVSRFCEHRRGMLGYGILVATALVVVIISFSQYDEVSSDSKVLVFAFCLLPIINGIFDFLSYGLTLKLVARGRSKRSVATLFYWGLDAGIAVVLLVAVGTVTTLIVGLINAMSEVPFLDLTVMFNDLHDPVARGEYQWLYLAFMTTLIPTAVHACLVFLSVFTWIPTTYKKTVAGWIVLDDSGSLVSLLGSLIVATIGALYALAATLVVLAIYYGLAGGFEHLAMFVLSCVEWIATAFGVL